jgi:4-hydroxy-2-oxoheptanedioate aldolase
MRQPCCLEKFDESKPILFQLTYSAAVTKNSFQAPSSSTGVVCIFGRILMAEFDPIQPGSRILDLQHGLIDYQSAVGMLQAISTTSTVPLVRVPWLDPAIIMKVLDAGAFGVICPMINSASEAREFVAACRYPPAGTRSCGPIRASIYAGPDYVANANRTIITMAMIETRAGLDNLDSILAVEGIDAIYIGPSDLALALGYEPQLDPTEAAVIKAVEHILDRAQKENIVAGIHTASTANAQQMILQGFQFVTISTDVRLLIAKVSEVLGAMGRGASAAKAASTPLID